MEALRIHLTQNSANYKRREVIDNKMTYPLPPYSTVIGALHDVCGFKEYHPMDVSIQGDYKSLMKKLYRDNMFLNTTFDDRGTLVKMINADCLSGGFEKVASALKSMGNSFKNGITISVDNEELLLEYRMLKEKSDQLENERKDIIKPKQEELKAKRLNISKMKKELDKKSDQYRKLDIEEKQLRDEESKLINDFKEREMKEYTIPYSKFRTLTTSIKYYEILQDVELFIHVASDHETLETILQNIYNLKALGRSEDFVNVIEASLVDLTVPDKEYTSNYHGYIDESLFETESVFLESKGKAGAQGTKYYLNKNYEIVDNKRVFQKKKVFYISKYSVDEDSVNVYIDNSNDEGIIVSLV